ncbi:ATP-dependent Clp endopeptidase, proteolytic subunit ClpP [Acetoanaerobium noterae]|uniref:ATP-dependent Clp protease proteolytic subunit n=1 Tax=Acetoanaerobium noterae TaxID=745369 RepID=A0A1T5ALL0_9FIRM|nr:head maturation protease, ClpP-related [Acetoanaerobium noterae]SKB35931.1 ATP-dependent Clp endopeptidase, proteolytic subunit ClpP [Acetoanaerobium noterae]
MAKVRIAGVIISNDQKWIYDWFEMDSFCPNDLRKAITDEYETIEVEINSGGGSVFAGSEIYTALKNHKGQVNVSIVGLAASAASVIAMAGKTVKMSPTAQFMVHNVSAQGEGDYRDMQHMADILKTANETVASAYILKTGKSKDEILAMMDKETWLTAEKAKEYGFIDEVMFTNDDSKFQLLANFMPNIIPTNVIEKMVKEKAQAELDILKLRGEIQ